MGGRSIQRTSGGSPDRNYRAYLIGTGLNYRLPYTGKYQIYLSFNYHERFDFDRFLRGPSKKTVNIAVVSSIGREFALSKYKIYFWLGPGYFKDKLTQYSRIFINNIITVKSLNNFGIATGTDVLIYNHYNIHIHFVYADFLQPRVGFAYEF